jgi:antitoxin YefM
MTIQTTYTQARANLDKLCNRVTANREIVIIQRRGVEDVALISAAEPASLVETAYLLRSPKNAERLLTALTRAQHPIIEPQSIAGA